MINRTLYTETFHSLSTLKNMLLLSGPRQVGKTTLSQAVMEHFHNHLYFNYDFLDSKRTLRDNPAFFENVRRVDDSVPLIVMDELHKYADWKNYLKGVYDQYADSYQFLITGSGRLDLYQQGGDSLTGRYLLFHLWPVTIAELSSRRRTLHSFMDDPLTVPEPYPEANEPWANLRRFSGFPEPFTKGRMDFYRLWSNTYQQQLIREDIRDAFQVRQIDTMETLLTLLPAKTGALLSINALSRLLKVGFDTTRTWLELFERFFLIFRVSPWSRRITRAIRKENKLYLFNHAVIQEDAQRFENMVALELFRAVTNWNDLGHGRYQLHFIRDKEKREVDFLLSESDNPFLLIECKLKDETPAKSLLKFQNDLGIPAVQLVNKDDVCTKRKNGDHSVLVITAPRWLSTLP